jgi:hypothetical protein
MNALFKFCVLWFVVYELDALGRIDGSKDA